MSRVIPICSLFISILLLLNRSTLATSSAAANSTDGEKTAYELLQSFNFPVGLLPKGVVKYDLDENTGQFHAYMEDSCSFSLEGSYKLQYKSVIGGYISNNRLTGLTGVSVKVLFLWLNIVEVVRNGDDIELSVGIASASFPIDNFYECPQCGCGLDCVTGQNHRDDNLWTAVKQVIVSLLLQTYLDQPLTNSQVNTHPVENILQISYT